MAVFNWFGGTGRFGIARYWDPRGVPGAGDTAVVGSGDVTVQGRQVDATVLLEGTDIGTAGTLTLRNASVAGLTMPSDLPATDTTTLPPQYGIVDVRGHSSIGSIEVGNFTDYLPTSAPGFPNGHGPLTVPDNLIVDLRGNAQLDTGFDLKDGSSLVVNGGAGSWLSVGNSSLVGSKAVINTPLGGQGTITVSGGGIPNENRFPYDTGNLQLGGAVGAGETIDLNIGRVLIAQPLQFAGTLNVQASEGGGIGVQDVMLRGLAASSYSFDDTAHTLTLYDGDAVLDTIQFSAVTTSGTFQPEAPAFPGYGHLSVVQTSEGVQLQGPFDDRPTGATDIPLHTATA